MTLVASFYLIGEWLSKYEGNLVKLIYDRMSDFVDGKNNDQCACAILNLSKIETC